ncbi:hypothetical protein C0993_007466 [Termitomyces sp. T159_Od127]|nr:hypothetical protein C0993_007466 [Termitomyces sp. T159_Od127]
MVRASGRVQCTGRFSLRPLDIPSQHVPVPSGGLPFFEPLAETPAAPTPAPGFSQAASGVHSSSVTGTYESCVAATSTVPVYASASGIRISSRWEVGGVDMDTRMGMDIMLIWDLSTHMRRTTRRRTPRRAQDAPLQARAQDAAERAGPKYAIGSGGGHSPAALAGRSIPINPSPAQDVVSLEQQLKKISTLINITIRAAMNTHHSTTTHHAKFIDISTWYLPGSRVWVKACGRLHVDPAKGRKATDLPAMGGDTTRECWAQLLGLGKAASAWYVGNGVEIDIASNYMIIGVLESRVVNEGKKRQVHHGKELQESFNKVLNSRNATLDKRVFGDEPALSSVDRRSAGKRPDADWVMGRTGAGWEGGGALVPLVVGLVNTG